METKIIQIFFYVIIGIVVIAIKNSKTKKLNEQKKLQRLLAQQEAEKQNDQQTNYDEQETVSNITTENKTNDEIVIKDSVNKEIVDYDKAAFDPNIDLIPDEKESIQYSKTTNTKSFFEEHFNEKFDAQKAIIYSEIINNKYI